MKKTKKMIRLAGLAGLMATVLTGCLSQPSPPLPRTPQNVTVRDFFNGTVELLRPILFTQFPRMDSTYLVVNLTGGISVVSWQDGAWGQSTFDDVPVLFGEDGGLLGFAFHPDYAENRKYYVYYVEPPHPGVIVLAEREADSTLLRGSGKPERRLLTLVKPYIWHNGGTLAFGTDGYLHTAIGDGGGEFADSEGRAQSPSTLFGKFLRIDVDGPDAFSSDTTRNYAIPPDNPFVDSAGYLPEIWAQGLRSPWKWTFHPITGEIWLGDVGQATREEISRIPKGGNLGWNTWEGTTCFNHGNHLLPLPDSSCSSDEFIRPVLDLPRAEAGSVIGGVFFHGNPASPFDGDYIFGDYVTGKIWALRAPDGIAQEYVEIAKIPGVVSFDVDAGGRLFATSMYPGKVYILESPDLTVPAQP